MNLKFKSVAFPKSVDVVYTGVTHIDENGKHHKGKLVQPDQALSLQEILDRFTRGESVPVGRQKVYHESDDDLEKVAKMDLVDKAEFVEKQKATQKAFDLQEKRKKKAAEKKAHDEAVAKATAELREKGSLAPKEGGKPSDPAK